MSRKTHFILVTVSLTIMLVVILALPERGEAAPYNACVTINNTANTATYRLANNAAVRLTYTENETGLVYSKPLPRSTWGAFRKAEAMLTTGASGPKVVRACVGPVYVITKGAVMSLDPQDADTRMAASRDQAAINQLLLLIVQMAARLPENERATVAAQLGAILPPR